LVTGEDFGDGADKCYFAMFRSEAAFLNTWQLGTAVMKRYYLVYDMSPYDHGENYIQVGVGEVNPEANIGQRKYDT
jgi:hypothetical protein